MDGLRKDREGIQEEWDVEKKKKEIEGKRERDGEQ